MAITSTTHIETIIADLETIKADVSKDPETRANAAYCIRTLRALLQAAVAAGWSA